MLANYITPMIPCVSIETLLEYSDMMETDKAAKPDTSTMVPIANHIMLNDLWSV